MLRDGVVDDLRAKRTDKLLQEALIDLTIQKGFAAVTVSDLTRTAGINRATFYRHFQDKFDLLDHYARTVYEMLGAAPEDGSPQPAAGLAAIFEHIRANARFYRVMLGAHGDPGFAEKIRHYIRLRIWRSLPAELQTEGRKVDLYLSCSASASMAAVLWWLEHDTPWSAEVMSVVSYQASTALSAMLTTSTAGRP